MPERGEIEAQVIGVVKGMLGELSASRAQSGMSLDSLIDRDLGLDSLARVELMTRLEREFSIQLPDSVIAEAATLADLVKAVVAPGAHVSGPRVAAAAGPRAGQGEFPAELRTLNDVLGFRAARAPNDVHMFLRMEDDTEKPITNRDLFTGAGAVAAGLQKRGLHRGETVSIMLPTGEEFFHSFLGVLLAGGVPVPIYPPHKVEHVEEYARKQSAILRSAEVRFLVTFTRVKALAKAMAADVPSLEEVADAATFSAPGEPIPRVEVNPEDLALIQYTSGSTGDPKGASLTHASLLANIRGFGAAAKVQPSDFMVSWLPLYHDMGLIGAWLGMLCWGIPVAVMSPLAFLARPERWLWTIHSHRATISGAPNFAYELCTKHITDSALEGLDLSSLRICFNGAEPVSAESMDKFAKRFKPWGFRPEALSPAYGLAENSLVVTFPELGRPTRIDAISREALEKERRAVPVPNGEAALKIASCGKPIPGTEVRIVDDAGKTVGERVQGRLQFRGTSAMVGYYRNREATSACFTSDGWVDSGDLAYIAEGEVFLAGRRKDLIIRGGRNLAPQELEEIAGEVAGVRKTCVAAFGLADQATGTEQIVVVAETGETVPAVQDRIRKEVTAAIAAVVGIPPDVVKLVPPETVPKTSSGKIRRSEARAMYLDGRLGVLASGRTQVMRVLAVGAFKKALKGALRVLHLAYAVWALSWVLVTGAIFISTALILPHGPRCARIVRSLFGLWGRVLLMGCGVIVLTRGKKNLRRAGPAVIVSNHTGYADTFILGAALGGGYITLAKEEVGRWPIVGPVVRRMDFLLVDRADPRRAHLTEEMDAVLKAGRQLLVFPEGTLTRTSGVRPFSLGAFKVAEETGLPIVPVAMKGARRILRDGARIPLPGLVRVTVGELIRPAGKGWNEAVRLRDAVKTFIAANCGEPVLDLTEVGPPPE